MALDILFTLFLVLLNGFFVIAEFSIVKIRLSQLEVRIRDGSRLAVIARGIISNLDGYLSATQLGVTLVSLGLGWIGEDVVSSIVLKTMNFIQLPLTPAQAHSVSFPVAFITITFLHIVFGELTPKYIAIQQPEKVTLAISLPLRIFYLIFKPFVWIINASANLFIRLIGFHTISGEEMKESHTSDELRYIIEESSKSGLIESSEHILLENVFEFSDIPVKQIMIPRGNIEAIDVNMSEDLLFQVFIKEGYSRMPVYKNSIDNIIGIIYAKDLLRMMLNKDVIILEDILRPPFFVMEDDKINKVLSDMRRRRIHLAIVIDEFGGTAGLVSLEDIIEEIVGEIQDEYDEEIPMVHKINDKEFTINALTSIDDANDYLPVPLPKDEEYETVAGLIISSIGRIPELNEEIILDNYTCKILKCSKRNIESVKLSLINDNENSNLG